MDDSSVGEHRLRTFHIQGYTVTGFYAVYHVVGVVLAMAGTGLLVDCFARFALEGRGTPAPVAPTETLVASGSYQYVRNPIYTAVLLIITGQALFFGSRALVAYAGVLWLAFHAFVIAYEEPTLRRRYGASYHVYSAHVGRWRPRITPWHGSEAA